MGAGPLSYTFPWPSVCGSVILTLSWNVYSYGTIPAFLTLANGTNESTLTMNPTSDTDEGIYTIFLTYTPDGDST